MEDMFMIDSIPSETGARGIAPYTLRSQFPILMVMFSSMYNPTSCCEKGWLYIHTDHSLILEVVNSKPSGSARPCFHPSPEEGPFYFPL